MNDQGKARQAAASRKACDTETLRLRDFVPAIGLLLVGLVALQIATISTRGVPGQYLVVARPGATAGETLTLIGDARGGLQRFTRFPNVMIASSSAPDFPAKLQASGAWLVLPSPVRSGCFSEPSRG